MEILFFLLVIILALIWLVFTYIVPIVSIICIINGVQLAWIPLCIWMIGITICGIIRECKEVKDDNKKSRQ